MLDGPFPSSPSPCEQTESCQLTKHHTQRETGEQGRLTTDVNGQGVHERLTLGVPGSTAARGRFCRVRSA